MSETQVRSYSPISSIGNESPLIAAATVAGNQPGIPSNDGSSALSEIEEGSDEDLRSDNGAINDANEHGNQSEAETEASTERLEVSPQKPQPITNAMVNNHEEEADPDIHESDFAVNAVTTDDLTPQKVLGQGGGSIADKMDLDDAELQEHEDGVKSPRDITGHKRKRSETLFNDGVSIQMGADRLQKHIHPNRMGNGSTHGDEESKEEDEEAVMGEDVTETNIEALASSPKALEDKLDEEPDAESPKEDEMQVDFPVLAEEEVEVAVEEQESVKEQEVDNEAGTLDVEDEEQETAAKTEDELVKKRSAMDALVPIEKMFAIFRDRQFDEQWKHLTAELELLQKPDTTHEKYFQQRQTLDSRRDEKLELERTALGYNKKALETKILATRAQIHAQYFQRAREIREKYLENLNEQFSQIQHERRQWKAREPQFSYKFETKRSRQISHQAAYNKEVSLLSGIAKHVGFPGAPEIKGASSADIEEDFRSMDIKRTSKPHLNAAQIVSSVRAEEAAAEEQFREKTPWANPNHPAHQHALFPDRQALSQNPRALTSSTPAKRFSLADLGRASAGSSTIAASSDPPSINATYSQHDTIPNTSSPSERMKRRKTPITDKSVNSEDAGLSRVISGQSDTFSTKSKPSNSYPIDSSSVQQSFNTSAIHSNNKSELLTNNPSFTTSRPGAFGTPGTEQPPHSFFSTQNLSSTTTTLNPNTYSSIPSPQQPSTKSSNEIKNGINTSSEQRDQERQNSKSPHDHHTNHDRQHQQQPHNPTTQSGSLTGGSVSKDARLGDTGGAIQKHRGDLAVTQFRVR